MSEWRDRVAEGVEVSWSPKAPNTKDSVRLDQGRKMEIFVRQRMDTRQAALGPHVSL